MSKNDPVGYLYKKGIPSVESETYQHEYTGSQEDYRSVKGKHDLNPIKEEKPLQVSVVASGMDDYMHERRADEPPYWKTQSKEQNIKTVNKIKKMLELLVSFIATKIKKTLTDEKRKKGEEINKMYLELTYGVDRNYYYFYEWTHDYKIGDSDFNSYNRTFSRYINDVFIVLKDILAPEYTLMAKYGIRVIMQSNRDYMKDLIKILVSDPDNQQVKEKLHEIINISTDFEIFDKIMPFLESMDKKEDEMEEISKKYRIREITENERDTQLNPKQKEMDILKNKFNEVTKSIKVELLPPQEVPPDVIEPKQEPKKSLRDYINNFMGKKTAFMGKKTAGKRRRSTKRKTKRTKRKQKRNTKRRASHRRRR